MKKPDAKKIFELAQLLNIEEGKAWQLLQPDFCGRKGFADHKLTNNGAKIREVKKRIARLEIHAQDVSSETQIGAVTIIEDVENNRVKVIFPERLNAEMHKTMRHAGFVYSRTNIAYQRKRSPQASHAAQECAEKYGNV